MKKVILLSLLILLIGCNTNSETLNIGFWNVENLFDLENDPVKNDDEFSLNGRKMVTQDILDMKINHLTEIIADLDVDILGLCEVENLKVLEMLNENYPDRNYSIIHFEGPDLRGIDVALLYDPSKFKVLESEPINIPFEDEDPTRDVLHVTGKFNGETLHLFVNHWPSNYSGLERGMRRRKIAADFVRKEIDNILAVDENANIILMGDFNEDPIAEAVKDVLMVTISEEEVKTETGKLWSPMAPIMGVENGGTYKYRDVDNVIDQFMVSKGLIDSKKLDLNPNSVKVMNKDKYRQQEGDFIGYPFRFWVGDSLLGGYSDHMAIHCTLEMKN